MTAIPYPDIVVFSPSRRYRLDIRSPDNDDFAPRAIEDLAPNHLRRFWTSGFQGDFVYTVTSTEAQDILWEKHARGSSLDTPAEAWLADDGAAVVVTRTTFSSELILLSPSGDVRYQVDVLEGVLEGNESEFHWTSAGPHWTEGGHGLFLAARGQSFWSFRNGHGRRIVLNVTQGRQESPAADLLSEIRRTEASWARQTLANAAEEAERWKEGAEELYVAHLNQSKTAALWAGYDLLTDTVPALRILERVPALWGYTFTSWRSSEREQLVMGRFYMRPMVKQVLRMLGVEPAGFSCYSFRYHVPERGFAECPLVNIPDCIADRAAKVACVQEDMRPHDALNLLGAPDFLRSDCWDYDFVAKDDGFTFRIDWDRTTWLPKALGVIRPGAWNNLQERLHWL